MDNEFEVRRKANGTPFQHDELLAAAEGADALFITPFDRQMVSQKSATMREM